MQIGEMLAFEKVARVSGKWEISLQNSPENLLSDEKSSLSDTEKTRKGNGQYRSCFCGVGQRVVFCGETALFVL